MRKFLAPVLVLVLAAGCSGSDPEPSETVTSSPAAATSTASATPTRTLSAQPSPSPSPSPSPTVHESFPAAPSTETPEQAEIRAAVIEYWRVLDKFTADPSLTDLSETQRVTTGDRQNHVIDIIASIREEGYETRGARTFRDLTVGLPSVAGGQRQSIVTYCHDPAGVATVESSTGQVVSDGQAPTFFETVTVEEGLDGVWRVRDLTNEKTDC